MLKEGDMAPDFALEDADGRIRKLGDFKGKMLVLYFYPKDDTPGCTTEACAFRDVYSEIQRKGASVVGVSPDSGESHRLFRDKFHLPFPLLADPEKGLIEAYGAWGERVKNDGSRSVGIIRSTFVIDAAGRIKKAFPQVNPEGHAAEILAVL
jgi:peroxiredoxin Q/BCP